jgi:Branched-chain amino acid aminotransferase/4-amino-4-deoxychorismate lyase
MCLWIETIKLIGGIPQNLFYHQQRMNNTLLFHGGNNFFSLHDFFINHPCTIQGIVKTRIVYDANKIIDFSFTSYQIKKIKSFAIIEVANLDYSFKSEDRKAFEEIKFSINTDEIIITQNGFITDTSFSNLIFKKNNQWFTPNTFLLNGTKRQQVLHDKKIAEAEISVNNLHTFSHFKLINAMIDLNEDEIFETKIII